MKKRLIVAVVLQLLALLAIAGKREWIHLFGETVYLRTAPVDPRDVFRGDYVELTYEIATPEQALLAPMPTKEYLPVYATLEIDHKRIATLRQLTTEPPAGLYIKGAIGPHSYNFNRGQIKYGIEKYFVEQGSGVALEQQRGRGQEWQTAMEMEVALGHDGTAVIRGHRWSDLGVRIETVIAGRNPLRSPNDAEQTTRKSAQLRVSFRNQSTQPLYLLDTPNHCALQLLENTYDMGNTINARQTALLPNRDCSDTKRWHLIALAPQEIYSIDIDLAESLWHAQKDKVTQELGAFDRNSSGYRFVYAPPQTAIAPFAQMSNVWTSPTSTARFFASGNVD